MVRLDRCVRLDPGGFDPGGFDPADANNPPKLMCGTHKLGGWCTRLGLWGWAMLTYSAEVELFVPRARASNQLRC